MFIGPFDVRSGSYVERAPPDDLQIVHPNPKPLSDTQDSYNGYKSILFDVENGRCLARQCPPLGTGRLGNRLAPRLDVTIKDTILDDLERKVAETRSQSAKAGSGLGGSRLRGVEPPPPELVGRTPSVR